MCGIAGIVHYNRLQHAAEAAARMSEAIAHRGPDAQGEYFDNNAALVHRRLSIIDPTSAADQPMKDVQQRYVLVFNGEIYNYQQLRNELNEYDYRSQTDTEVILAAWSKWGAQAVHRLDGIFAFALWDRIYEEIWLVRDRMGVKPLYFTNSDGMVHFSSELRSLVAGGSVSGEIDPLGLSSFLHYHSVGYGHSLLKGVQQLAAGTWMKVTRSGSEIHRYFSLDSAPQDSILSLSAIQGKILDLMMKAVQKRLMSDVPIGAFLSGGVDSSAVVALMSLAANKPIDTFTLSMDAADREDEEYAVLFSKNYHTRHRTIRMGEQDLLELSLKGLRAMDSPTADGINTYMLSSIIRASGFKVALSGIGADELFGGYPGFGIYQFLMQQKTVFDVSYPVRKLSATFIGPFLREDRFKWKDLMNMPKIGIDQFYPLFRKTTSSKRVRSWLKNSRLTDAQLGYTGNHANPFLSPGANYSLAEQQGYAQATLLRDADQMGMAVGLEIREPYFDPALWEFVLSVPDHVKLNGRPKQLLTHALSPLLPVEMINRKKKGFVLPWEKWMRRELATFCAQEIREFSERKAVNGEQVLVDWKSFLNNNPNLKWIHFWQLVVLNVWLKKMRIDI